MDEDRIVRMSLLLLAAILAAMTQARLLIHVHVYPPPATRSKDAQGSENFKEHKFVHKFDLTVPTELPPSGRLIATEGSASPTPRQGIAPAPRGTAGLSNFCEADRGHVMCRADVEAGACSTHEAVAASSYRERTVQAEKRAREALGDAIEDAIPRLHGGASYATDKQRADVHVQPGEALADRDDVVRPPRRKVPRRRFHPRMSSGNAGSSRAGLSR